MLLREYRLSLTLIAVFMIAYTAIVLMNKKPTTAEAPTSSTTSASISEQSSAPTAESKPEFR